MEVLNKCDHANKCDHVSTLSQSTSIGLPDSQYEITEGHPINQSVNIQGSSVSITNCRTAVSSSNCTLNMKHGGDQKLVSGSREAGGDSEVSSAEDIIGKQNLVIVRRGIREGKIEVRDIRNIAKKMRGSPYGTFLEKDHRGEEPVDIFDFMMEKWFAERLCKEGVDGYQELVDILTDEEVALYAIAAKLSPVTTD